MLSLLEAVVGLATAIFKDKAAANGVKYRDQLVQLKLNIVNEWAKGQAADDTALEGWLREFQVIVDAAASEAQTESATAGK